MSTESHAILDGKAGIYRRQGSRFWQCAIFLEGRTHRASTRQDRVALALEIAREWALDRLAEARVRRLGLVISPAKPAADSRKPLRRRRPVRAPAAKPNEKTFRDAAVAFVTEYEALTKGERNPRYVAGKSRHLQLYLLPFFGDKPLSEVTAGLIQDYRLHRANPPKPDPRARRLRGGKWCRVPKSRPPARNTLHQERRTPERRPAPPAQTVGCGPRASVPRPGHALPENRRSNPGRGRRSGRGSFCRRGLAARSRSVTRSPHCSLAGVILRELGCIGPAFNGRRG
jgi:hypothetical protein